MQFLFLFADELYKGIGSVLKALEPILSSTSDVSVLELIKNLKYLKEVVSQLRQTIKIEFLANITESIKMNQHNVLYRKVLETLKQFEMDLDILISNENLILQSKEDILQILRDLQSSLNSIVSNERNPNGELEDHSYLLTEIEGKFVYISNTIVNIIMTNFKEQ